MTEQEAQKILDTVETFCQENEGNTMNQWLRNALVNTMQTLLKQILQRQNEETTEPEEIPLPPVPPEKRIINEDNVKPIAPEIVKRKEGDQPKIL